MDATDLAQLVTSGTAVVALGVAIWQVRSSRLQARDTTTHQYVAKLADAEFLKHLARSMDALELDAPTPEKVDVRWREFQALDHEDQLDIAAPFNAFEAIGGLYNLDHLNTAIVERQVGNTAQVVLERIWWWVGRARRSNPRYFAEWQTMLERMDRWPPDDGRIG